MVLAFSMLQPLLYSQCSHFFIACVDVLEHIEPKLIDAVLQDLARVTKVKGYFTVAMYPARRVLKDGRNAHLIVEKAGWWLNKICKYFNISSFSDTNGQLDVQVIAKIITNHEKNIS